MKNKLPVRLVIFVLMTLISAIPIALFTFRTDHLLYADVDSNPTNSRQHTSSQKIKVETTKESIPGKEPETLPTEPVCICTTKCTADNININCPVCRDDYTQCKGGEPNPEPSPEPPEPTNDIVWIGDSLTQGSTGDDNQNQNNPQAPWRQLAAMTTNTVEGYGYYGMSAHDCMWLYGTTENPIGAGQSVSSDKIYILWVGSNDFRNGPNAYSTVKQEIDNFLSKGPVDKYIIIGTTDRIEIRDGAYQTINNNFASDYNEHYLDMMSVKEFGPDDLHLTDKSYHDVAVLVYNKLLELGYINGDKKSTGEESPKPSGNTNPSSDGVFELLSATAGTYNFNGQPTSITTTDGVNLVTFYDGVPAAWGWSKETKATVWHYQQTASAWAANYGSETGGATATTYSNFNRFRKPQGTYSIDGVACIGCCATRAIVDCAFTPSGKNCDVNASECNGHEALIVAQSPDGNYYYIPTIIVTTKAHTYPGGIVQTTCARYSSVKQCYNAASDSCSDYGLSTGALHDSAGHYVYSDRAASAELEVEWIDGLSNPLPKGYTIIDFLFKQ